MTVETGGVGGETADWRTDEMRQKARAALISVLDGKAGRNAAVRVRLALMVLGDKQPEAKDWTAPLDEAEIIAAEAAAKGKT